MRFIVLTMLALTGAATAQIPSSPTPEAAKDVKKPRLKCETVDDTGTRVGRKRVCYDPQTRTEDDHIRQDLDRMRQSPRN